MKDTHYLFPFAVLAGFILLALVYGLVVPPFENLDEVEHFEVVRYIVDTGHLPTHGTPSAAGLEQSTAYHYRQEASQPPLYHLLSAGLVRLLRLDTDDTAATLRLNPWVACGPGAANLYDNRAVLYHNPNQEAFPWQSTLLTLHVLRIWSTLLQSVTVIGTYILFRLAFPQRRRTGLVAMSIVAFNPQFLLVASGVNNDNLVTPLVTVGLYLLLRIWQDGLSVRRVIGLGLLTGLAGLTKLSGWLLLILSVMIVLIRAYRPLASQASLALHRFSSTSSSLISHLSSLIFPAMVVAGWWFWRNWRLYQDVTALQPMLDLVGRRDGSVLQSLMEAGTMFRSFWGQIPCSFYPAGFYVFYTVLTALAFGSLVWNLRRFTSPERSTIAILTAWFLLIVASWIRWNMMTPAPGGRLLFPALPAVASSMALGIGELTQGRQRWSNGIVVGLMMLVAGWTALHILPSFFAPPPRFPNTNMPTSTRSLDATLGDTVQLLGYNVALDDQPAVGPPEPDPTLDVTLYWQALTPMTRDYVLALQLVSPVPGDMTLRWNYNSWPGHGNYPTSAWRPDEVIADRYRFRLPEGDFPTQAWDVHVALYHNETGSRLPVRLHGSEAGHQVVLARLRVRGQPSICPAEGTLTSEVRFGEAIALTHATTVLDQENIQVVLCWRSLQTLSIDYTVFVHLEDASGRLVGTGDGPPMRGAFPTSLWHPGDIILDVHLLPAPSVEDWPPRLQPQTTGYRITAGLYRPDDGSRLPVTIDGAIIPHAAAPVWPDRP